MHRLRSCLIACVALGSAPLAAQSAYVVPPAQMTSYGSSYSGFIWGTNGQNKRDLCCYGANLFARLPGPITITQLAWRAARSTVGTTIGPISYQVACDLSTTSAAPLALQYAFDANHGADRTQVWNATLFVGPLVVQDRQFTHVMPLAVPFVYDPRGGNLLVDLVCYGVAGTLPGAQGPFQQTPEVGRITQTASALNPVANFPGQGATQNFAFELEITGQTCRGTVVLGGAGCRDRGGVALEMRSRGCPDRLAIFTPDLRTSLVNNGATFLLIGTDATQWLGIPLPFDLGVLGGNGCTLYTSQELLLGPLFPAGGTASLPLAIPPGGFLAGARVYLQFANLAPGVNPLGLVTSEFLSVTIG
ncbi:MAG: hypothetical protein JNM84_28385 [Planctomycetes bacterium]|nr:hypothetical protein [Planctomycetota bacterium]